MTTTLLTSPLWKSFFNLPCSELRRNDHIRIYQLHFSSAFQWICHCKETKMEHVKKHSKRWDSYRYRCRYEYMYLFASYFILTPHYWLQIGCLSCLKSKKITQVRWPKWRRCKKEGEILYVHYTIYRLSIAANRLDLSSPQDLLKWTWS